MFVSSTNLEQRRFDGEEVCTALYCKKFSVGLLPIWRIDTVDISLTAVEPAMLIRDCSRVFEQRE